MKLIQYHQEIEHYNIMRFQFLSYPNKIIIINISNKIKKENLQAS